MQSLAGLCATATATLRYYGDGQLEIKRDLDAGTCYAELRGFGSVTGTYQLDVSAASGGGQDSYCRDGDTIRRGEIRRGEIRRGERCDSYGTDAYFEVDSSGRGCPRNVPGLSIGCLSGNVRIFADRSGGGYRIVDVEPEPED